MILVKDRAAGHAGAAWGRWRQGVIASWTRNAPVCYRRG